MKGSEEVLFGDYVEFIGYFNNADYRNAAQVMLHLLRLMCTNPQVNEEYQLPSLTHFLKEAAKGPEITFEGFEYLLRGFLAAYQSGKLRDTRIVAN